MAAYAVFQNPNPKTSATVPYLLDVQSEVLSLLGTRVVVPLYRPGSIGVQAMSRLTPVLRIQGQPLVAMVPELASIPTRELAKAVGDLAAAQGEILQAIDLLLTGC
jgi:toxin CcdB